MLLSHSNFNNMLLFVRHLIRICLSSNQLIYFSKCRLFKRILLQCCCFMPELLCYQSLINHCFVSCEVSLLSMNDSFWIWFDNCFSCLLTIFSPEAALSLVTQLEFYPFWYRRSKTGRSWCSSLSAAEHPLAVC